ncbi:MAG TPA: hypothetical protein VH482_17305, partial [Thermomicrobiales bacterium]
MRLRLDLDHETYDALTRAAVTELRPLPWQAELILRRHLGTLPTMASGDDTRADRREAPLE